MTDISDNEIDFGLFNVQEWIMTRIHAAWQESSASHRVVIPVLDDAIEGMEDLIWHKRRHASVFRIGDSEWYRRMRSAETWDRWLDSVKRLLTHLHSVSDDRWWEANFNLQEGHGLHGVGPYEWYEREWEIINRSKRGPVIRLSGPIVTPDNSPVRRSKRLLERDQDSHQDGRGNKMYLQQGPYDEEVLDGMNRGRIHTQEDFKPPNGAVAFNTLQSQSKNPYYPSSIAVVLSNLKRKWGPSPKELISPEEKVQLANASAAIRNSSEINRQKQRIRDLLQEIEDYKESMMHYRGYLRDVNVEAAHIERIRQQIREETRRLNQMMINLRC